MYKSNICEIIEGTLGINITSKWLLTKNTMDMVSNGSFLGDSRLQLGQT